MHTKQKLEFNLTFLDFLSDSVILYDLDGNILYANKAACRMRGYEKKELIGKNFFDLILPEYRDAIKPKYEKLLKEEELFFESVHFHKDGSIVPLEVRVRMVDLKGKKLILGVGRNIAERKQAEEELLFRLKFEETMIAISSRFLSATEIDEAINETLRDIGKLSGADRSYLFFFKENGAFMDNTHEWCRDGVIPQKENLRNLPTEMFPWWMKKLRNDGFIHIPDVSQMPSEALVEQKTLQSQNIQAVLVYALKEGHELTGFIGFDNVKKAEEWGEKAFTLIQMVSNLIGKSFERKRVNEILLLSEEKYSKIFKTTPVWITISTLEDGRYTEVNENFLEVTGFRREEVIGKTAYELKIWDNPEDRDFIALRLKEKGKVSNFEAKFRIKSGQILDRLVSADTVEIAGKQYMVGVSLDITDRKRAEEILKASEEKYRTLVESSSDAILMLDAERNIASCNEAFCNLFGYDRREIEGRSIRILHPSDESFHFFGERAYPIVNQKGSFRGEWTLIRKNGSEVPVEHVISTIKAPDGSISGYVNMARDISERKRAEKERTLLEEQLRQSQKMEAIGRLVGGIAHDFNNLLTIILGNCDFSLSGIREEDPLKGNIEEIRRASEKAAGLTHQLLAFSRRQILEPKVLDLNVIISNMDKMLQRIIGEDIELITVPARNCGRVKIDPGQIEQVIFNLVVNAKDAMPQGGKLTIETADVELDESYVRKHTEAIPGQYVMLSLTDTGLGMTPDIRERIFEPFFTTKELGKGTGLGLSTVYGIVKQSGGDIWVYSEPEKGTTFKIYLPRVDEPLDELTDKKLDDIPLGSETILVVEDDQTIKTMAAKILTKLGYRVLEASDGAEAIYIFKEQMGSIDLILTDVVMPLMSGRQLIQRLKLMSSDLKVLYMSGYTDNAIAHHGILEQGINYIQKPFTLEGLAKKVREVLDA